MFFYFIIMNCIGILLMCLDKMKAKRNLWRIKESTLILVAILGGCFGIYSGMYIFRHKIHSIKFYIGIPIICLLYLVCIIKSIV